MPNAPTALNKGLRNYAQLRKAVQETLFLGRQRIEEAKVRTYLETGKLIDEHILVYSTRSEHYGKEVIERLSADLKISDSVLWRCLRFARSFNKILARGPESLPKRLAWSHYRKLITVADENSRLSFMQRAEKGGWSAEELGGKIRLETGGEKTQDAQPGSGAPAKDAKPLPRLIPKRGMLYTYRLIAPDSLHDGDDRLWIDLGFQVHRRIPLGTRGFKEGDIVQTERKVNEFQVNEFRVKLANSQLDNSKLANCLYTYKAFVERVVDADTLIVKIDLGFENRVRQYLRLRGINAPELSTEAGKKAKAFVERELSKVPHVILTSSRSDKYDRYLADVFYGEGKDERYLNQVLLDEGLAERM